VQQLRQFGDVGGDAPGLVAVSNDQHWVRRSEITSVRAASPMG
jgi:hypothetical protein